MGLKGMKTDYKPSIPLFVDLEECFSSVLRYVTVEILRIFLKMVIFEMILEIRWIMEGFLRFFEKYLRRKGEA